MRLVRERLLRLLRPLAVNAEQPVVTCNSRDRLRREVAGCLNDNACCLVGDVLYAPGAGIIYQ